MRKHFGTRVKNLRPMEENIKYCLIVGSVEGS